MIFNWMPPSSLRVAIMVDLCCVLELDLCSFLDVIEVAAIRTLCKAARKSVEDEDEESFNFTIPLPDLHLPLFQCESHLRWVIDRQRDDCLLIRGIPCPSVHRRAQHKRWRSVGIDPSWIHVTIRRRYLLNVLSRAFWYHDDVQATLTAAIRLDSAGLLRRLAVKAPGVCLSDDNPNTDGPANFLHNVWVFIEEAHFREHGPWEPLGRDIALVVDSDLFFSRLHFVLWKYMAAVRKRQQRDFKGYCDNCDDLFLGVTRVTTCDQHHHDGEDD